MLFCATVRCPVRARLCFALALRRLSVRPDGQRKVVRLARRTTFVARPQKTRTRKTSPGQSTQVYPRPLDVKSPNCKYDAHPQVTSSISEAHPGIRAPTPYDVKQPASMMLMPQGLQGKCRYDAQWAANMLHRVCICCTGTGPASMMHRAWACTYDTGPTTLMHSRACEYGAACKYAAQGLQICCIRPANMMHRACKYDEHGLQMCRTM